MKTFLLFIIMLLLVGCSTHTTPIMHHTLTTKAATQSSSHISKSIKIGMPSSTTLLATDSIYYTQSNGRSGTYLYSAWSNPPVVMTQESLFSTLERANLFTAITPYSSLGQTDYLLESTLVSFQHTIIDEVSSEGLIDISMRIIDLQTKKIITTKRFIIHTPANSNNALGGVGALQEGLDSLNTQVREWLETTIKEQYEFVDLKRE